MTPFEILFVAHIVGDWLFQTEYQAMNKAKRGFFNWALVSHCLVYTLCFLPALWITGSSWWWLGYIFWTHMLFDRRWPVVGIIRVLKRTSQETIDKNFWLVVVVDQVIHVLTLIPIVCF